MLPKAAAPSNPDTCRGKRYKYTPVEERNIHCDDFAPHGDAVAPVRLRDLVAQSQDVAGLRASVASLEANLETNRSQTNTAIIEFSARVEALDRDSAARMLYAARDNAVRFEKLDRDVTVRLAEVDRFVARTSERVGGSKTSALAPRKASTQTLSRRA